MTGNGMSVGLHCLVISHTVGFNQGQRPESNWEETTGRKNGHRNEVKGTKILKPNNANKLVNDFQKLASKP